MLARDLVAEHGGGFVMVDVITAGWAAVQSVRERCEDHGLAIHAHRAMHAAFDRLDHHGVSMRVIAQIARLRRRSHSHRYCGAGKLANEDTPGINEWLTGDCHGLQPVLPVASGGLHPGVVDQLLEVLGTDIIVQAGGGVHGHPDGTHAGAKAPSVSRRRRLDGGRQSRPTPTTTRSWRRRSRSGVLRHRGDAIVATESHCTPDRTTAFRSVCEPFQWLLSFHPRSRVASTDYFS